MKDISSSIIFAMVITGLFAILQPLIEKTTETQQMNKVDLGDTLTIIETDTSWVSTGANMTWDKGDHIRVAYSVHLPDSMDVGFYSWSNNNGTLDSSVSFSRGIVVATQIFTRGIYKNEPLDSLKPLDKIRIQ